MKLTRWSRLTRKHLLLILLVVVTWSVWRPPIWPMTPTCKMETRDEDHSFRYRANVALQKSSFHIWDTAILLAGQPRPEHGLFTIGIPTVQRTNGSYLFTTLQSLINETSHGEHFNTTIVICVNDRNTTYVSLLVENIKLKFARYLKEGFVQVITPPPSYYPSLLSLKQTFGDAKRRVEWRSKQNLDYAFLINYAYSMVRSKYYLQLEDDVVAASGYIEKMKKFINEQSASWIMLDFSVMGFIGKLYKNEDLSKLSYLLRLFYNEQPCDFLLLHFLNLMLQRNRYIRIPTLFSHIGKHSSLSKTIRDVNDPYFEGECKVHKGDNPPATLQTTIQIYEDNELNMAYNTSKITRYFWGKTPLVGQIISIVFQKPQNITRVVIETGNCATSVRDRIHGAILEYGTRISYGEKTLSCSDYKYLDKFIAGRLVYNASTLIDVKCLKITITEEHKQWLIVKEVAVFASNYRSKHI